MDNFNASGAKIAVVMGSDSDLKLMIKSLKVLKEFNIRYDVRIISAHRTPEAAYEFAKNAKNNGFDLIIAAAGKAAHLAGIIAALTALPVIGVPVKSSTLDGLDSLLSVVQMPKGIPVATVAIDGAENAAILAVQILSLKYTELYDKLLAYKKRLADEVGIKNDKLKEEAL